MTDGPDTARSGLEPLALALRAHLVRRIELGQRRTPAPACASEASGVLVPVARAPTTRTAVAPDSGLFRETVRESEAAAANRARAAECQDLDALRAQVASCTACRLCHTRTQTVFADGSPRARVLFIGEAPGQHEDEQGVPFVGQAGRLLTDIIQKGMRLARSEVYIANVLKCRPPENREPAADEKELCTPYLDRQIELVNPELLITLGLHAARHVLKSPAPMARLRGRVHVLSGRKVVATYHPAYLLRNPEMKKPCWEDIQLAMRELGLSSPGKPRTGS